MTRKTVAFKPRSQPAADPADSWVAASREEQAAKAVTKLHADQATDEPMKRFTIDVTESLHKRIKSQCAIRGVKMADVIRDLLEKEFEAPTN